LFIRSTLIRSGASNTPQSSSLKKAAFSPLGLLTVVAMLLREWEKKVVDMNTENLNNKDIEWADYVFLSAMAVQRAMADSFL